MRHLPLVALATLLALPAAAHAQRAEYYFDLGATYASPLVTDDVLEPTEIQQSIAPTGRIGAAVPFSNDFRVGAEIGFGSGGHEAEYGTTTNDLGGLSTLTLQATVGGPLIERLRWRLAVGTIKYLPSEETGIFAQGGPWRPLAGVALEYRLPISSALDLRIVGRADVHSFTTDELGDRGFGASQWVQRYALGVGLWRFGS
ncbi:MAG TPA: hypothetical protein VFY20_03300 [Gemmatimonadales bacterium]|nr:hypothetical protein [Gemmatimonadales bacterium]